MPYLSWHRHLPKLTVHSSHRNHSGNNKISKNTSIDVWRFESLANCKLLIYFTPYLLDAYAHIFRLMFF